jgi:uncharacterized protein YdhG (YjbR/CyaY superfamily)
MPKTHFRSVDEYIRAQPKDVQPVLRRVRSVIRKAVPAAVEVISYQLPAYKVAGGFVLSFAAWKQHYSLYPASDELMAVFGDTLAPFRASKGTLRFPLSEPVPVRLIERVARFRAKAVVRRAKARLTSAARTARAS